LVCHFGFQYGAQWIKAPDFWVRMTSLFALIAIAALAYLGMCFLLHVSEVRTATSLIWKKIARRR
jgi:hypothetical protein